jgi:hypothetical protein
MLSTPSVSARCSVGRGKDRDQFAGFGNQPSQIVGREQASGFDESSQPRLSSASSATTPVFAVNSACDLARQAAR